jgi:hypothetical protein
MSDPYGMADALETIEAENPQTFSWNGSSYKCVSGELMATKDLESGGFALQADRRIVVRRALFTDTQPQPKQTITMDARLLRIDSIEASTDGAFYVLTCNDPTRGI